ncbi:MAG: hypothetical protein AAFW89_01800 [Bacteroidota bacterium]
MRSFFSFFGVVLVLSTAGYGQATFRQTLTDPEVVYRGYAAINYLTVDAGFSNTSGASLWSIGADVLYPINDNLRVDAFGYYSLLSLESDGLPFLFSGGVEYGLFKKTKNKKVPVLLAFSYEKDYVNNKELQTWSTVALPGTIQREFTARGGVYLRNSAFEYDENQVFFDVTNVFHAGVYAGIGYTKRTFLHVQDEDGYTFAYGRQVRPYADLMILPTSVDVRDEATNTSLSLEETLGWRAGLTWQLTPFTKAENFDRKIGFFGNTLFRLEIGNRPLDGFYITTGVAFTIKKFR